MFNINKIRNVMYRLAAFLGDVHAVQNGTIIQRLIRKFALRHVGSFINKFLR